MISGELPKKERLLVRQLRNFIDNDQEYSVALIAGIRQTGKSTILKQLKEFYYPDAVYIDLSEDGVDIDVIDERFLDNPTSLLLLDEISHMKEYERYAQLIYDLSAGEHNRKFKAIMTGSSSAHIIKLSSSKLGGGRSRLFRLPPVMFVEYLYFTGRIPSYTEYSHVQPEDFEDYLFLKGLDNNLRVQFDDDYFKSFYGETLISNASRFLGDSYVGLEDTDLSVITNLLAYKLSEASSYDSTVKPNVGGQEHIHLSNLSLKIKKSGIDLSGTIIAESKQVAPSISPSDIGRILAFLLYSGLAHVEHNCQSDDMKLASIGYILDVLKNNQREDELKHLFNSVSICMTSPLFYTRLGSEIMEMKGVTPDVLRKGMLFGKMLELYVRGSIAMQSSGFILTSVKLDYSNGGDAQAGEVDIWNQNRMLLCELGTDNKKDEQLNLRNYFKENAIIRIGSSRTKEYFTGEHYRIPYAKLCCMVDIGDVFKLDKTVIQDLQS
jgi:hypothetical protein